MKVLIGCENSATVRDAFRALGHDAWSNDLLPTDGDATHHIQGDVFAAIASRKWDLIILHPPCTYLTSSGVRWCTTIPKNPRKGVKYGAERVQAMHDAAAFVKALHEACGDTPHAIENPVGRLSTLWRKPDQIVQPWMFGHGEQKGTALWLHKLPKLTPTNIVKGREQRMWALPPTEDRWKLRSKTYEGIARAMAQQWSAYLTEVKAA